MVIKLFQVHQFFNKNDTFLNIILINKLKLLLNTFTGINIIFFMSKIIKNVIGITITFANIVFSLKLKRKTFLFDVKSNITIKLCFERKNE